MLSFESPGRPTKSPFAAAAPVRSVKPPTLPRTHTKINVWSDIKVTKCKEHVLDSIVIMLHGLLQILIDNFAHDDFISSTFFQTLRFSKLGWKSFNTSWIKQKEY